MQNKLEEHVIIDRFMVPKAAMQDFRARIKLSMQIIAMQAGFVDNRSYEQIDHKEESTYITIVTWESREDLEKSMLCVQAKYDKLSFDPSRTMESLHIALDRGIYTEVKNEQSAGNRLR
jgi:predicted methyltransferase